VGLRLKILELHISNFKGIKEFSLNLQGKSAIIRGQNASGKTSVADAFFFCMFGTDSSGVSQFNIKPIDEYGNPVSNLTTSVESVIDLDGKIINLRKEYFEVYEKKGLGKALKGHTTNCFFNSVQLKKSDYEFKISLLFDKEAFNFVTNPLTFNALSWSSKRDFLLKMCDNISHEKILKSIPDISIDFGEVNPDEYFSILISEKKRIEKEFEHIPVKIAENAKQVKTREPDMSVKEKIQKRLSELNLIIAKNDLETEQQRRVNTYNEKRTELFSKKTECENMLHLKYKEFNAVEDDIKLLEKRHSDLLESITEIRNRTPDTSNTCKLCGQDLSDTARKEKIRQYSIYIQDILNTEEAEIKIVAINIQKEKAHARKLYDEYLRLNEYLETVLGDLFKLENEFNQNITDKDSSFDSFAVKSEIAKIEEEMEKINIQQAEYKAGLSALDRIYELESMQKELSKKYDQVEKDIYFATKYLEKRAELIEEESNKKFNLVKWKLFKKNLNGNIEPICTATCNGIPYQSLNSGAKIQVGIDIINTISDHLNFTGPVILDNMESVTWLPELKGQYLKFIVDPAYKELSIEYT